MTYIQLITNDQQLLLLSDAAIAAGDRETVTLTAATDAPWQDFALYATFWRDGESERAQDVPLDESGSCIVPPALLKTSGTLCIGIRGEDILGRRKTSSTARYRILPGTPDAQGAVLADVADGDATPAAVLAGARFYAGSEEPMTGTIETYTAGDVIEETPTVPDIPTVPSPAPVPLFDLTALGLPALTPDRGYTHLTTDTAEMTSALHADGAKFRLTARLDGTDTPLTAHLHPITDGAGNYLCTAAADVGTQTMLLTVNVSSGSLAAKIATLESKIGDYINEALGGDY